MEKAILELYEELDKERSANPMMDLSKRRSLKIRQFIQTIGNYDHQMLQEIDSLKAKLLEVTEEHKVSLTLNSKTVNSLVKMHEKTQEALDEKTNELAHIKQELQSVNATHQELLQKIEESKIVKKLTAGNQIKTELKVEMKEEPLKDLHLVHGNSKQIAKQTEGEENWKLKEEQYFDEVYDEMGIDFVTSKTFDDEYIKMTNNKDQGWTTV
jgi:isopentenyl diphosphate isomerase/L-lactate dehydrogenase-like FMN-dependent dehydrogenase